MNIALVKLVVFASMLFLHILNLDVVSFPTVESIIQMDWAMYIHSCQAYNLWQLCLSGKDSELLTY